MSRSPAATDASHESENENQHNSLINKSGAKDRECPYCGQKFTSSSLGRHLDQFISKKKPDGVHDVDEIKKLRSNITRRSVKGKRGDADEDEGQERAIEQMARPQALAPLPSSAKKGGSASQQLPFNKMSWQATGVMTDVGSQDPPVPQTASPIVPSNGNGNGISLAGTKRSYSAFAADVPPGPTQETIRALELSLREVLDVVNVAANKVAPAPAPFSFEFTAQSFPALCLKLLPIPPTVDQQLPFSAPETLTIRAPGYDQLQAVRNKISQLLDDWKWIALAHLQRHATSDTDLGDEADKIHREAAERGQNCIIHLDQAFQFYVNHTQDQQQHLWTLEILRVLRAEQNKTKEMDEQVSSLNQEVAQLQQQVDHLSKCQWPREMALWPPETHVLPSRVAREIAVTSSLHTRANGDGKPTDTWDFEKLVNKWKRRIREDKARKGASTQNVLLPSLNEANTQGAAQSPTVVNLRKSTTDHNSTQTKTQPKSQTNSPTSRSRLKPPDPQQQTRVVSINGSSHSNSPSNTQYPAQAFQMPNGHAFTGNGMAGPPMYPNMYPSAYLSNAPSNNYPNTRIPLPSQMGNMQSMPTVGDQMARFIPYMNQKEMTEGGASSRMNEN